MKTITKLAFFVTVSVFSIPACSVLGHFSERGGRLEDVPLSKDFGKPEVIGNLDASELPESSGLTASPCQPGVLWTHNDSGGGPYVYAIDMKGGTKGVWNVLGAAERDWEDIASAKDPEGDCYLYIGDIGDNEEKYASVLIYRVKEPNVDDLAGAVKKKDAQDSASAGKIEIRYPDGSHNSETLLVHPGTFDIYLITKNQQGPASVFRVRRAVWRQALDSGQPAEAEKVAELLVPAIAGGFLTGGDISPDGSRVAISDYFSAYEFTLPEGEEDFDKVWTLTPAVIDAGARQQGESIAYSTDSTSLFLSSEKNPSPLIRIDRMEKE